MGLLHELMDDEYESIIMPEKRFLDLINEAFDEITGESDNDNPFTAFSLGRTGEKQYEFSTSYNGWTFDSINIKVE